MQSLTICLPFYRNHGMLEAQCARFRKLPIGLKKHLRLIVVDDGSPKGARAEHEDIGFPFSLFRITVDVRWNQDAARNLAVKHAQTEWVLLTDMDHIPPRGTLTALVEGEWDRRIVYRFSRQTLESDGRLTDYKPHPNSWFMTSALYWKVGGCDESLAGFYGTDADFRSRVEILAGKPAMLSHSLIRVPRDVIPDASTTTYTRKDPEIDGELGTLIRKRNATPGWQPKHFSFPWERVA